MLLGVNYRSDVYYLQVNILDTQVFRANITKPKCLMLKLLSVASITKRGVHFIFEDGVVLHILKEQNFFLNNFWVVVDIAINGTCIRGRTNGLLHASQARGKADGIRYAFRNNSAGYLIMTIGEICDANYYQNLFVECWRIVGKLITAMRKIIIVYNIPTVNSNFLSKHRLLFKMRPGEVSLHRFYINKIIA